MSFAKKDELVEQGYLSKSQFQHLVLYNYTDKCTYDRNWIPETLESRGTIYDLNTGKIVARAFDKFFNLGEHNATVENLPQGPFDVEEKVDGSLGILYQIIGEWKVATRGSFYSDQAVKATILLEKYNLTQWPEGWTPLVEIIYPENRILIDYGSEEKLVLLAARHIEEGRYMDRRSLDMYARRIGMQRPKHEDATVNQLVERAASLPGDHEGWVISYPNGFRVKVKGARYLELARFKSNLNPLTIWETMMNEKVQELLEKAPEELREEAEDQHAALMTQWLALLNKANTVAVKLGLQNPLVESEAKGLAHEIYKQPEWMRGYLFAVMRGQRGFKAESVLLKLLRPKSGILLDIQKIFNLG